MAKTDKIWMETTRTRAANGISTWEVEMSQKFLERVAEQNNGLTYRNEEKFEVSMKVKDGSSGYIKHIDTGKVINYLAKVFKPAEDKVQVDFLVNQTDTFSYPFAATFRGYTTGAFYRFFNHIIRNRPDYFATITMEIAKKEEAEATEEKAIEQTETQVESTAATMETPQETATAQPEVVEESKVDEEPKKFAKKSSKKAKKTDIEAEIPVVKPDVITEDVLEEPAANTEAAVAEEIVHEASETDKVASSEANDVVTITEAVSEDEVKEEKPAKKSRKPRSKKKEIEEVDLDKLLEEVDAAN